MIYGYARVSSTSQDLTVQEDALRDAGCDIIRSEKVSANSLVGRSEIQNILDFAREGDTIVVTRVDRLARSVRDLQNLVFDLSKRGVSLRAIEQPVDTTTSAGKCFLDMLSVFAEFETNLRRERQIEGIQKAKMMGVYKGRKKKISDNKIIALKMNGNGVTEISEQLGISRSSVYRAIKSV